VPGAERLAGLIRNFFVILKMVSKIRDWRSKIRKVKPVIRVRIDDELNRGTFALLARHSQLVLAVGYNRESTGFKL
jgi:hypothetical protein